jgi:hypothetical protein
MMWQFVPKVASDADDAIGADFAAIAHDCSGHDYSAGMNAGLRRIQLGRGIDECAWMNSRDKRPGDGGEVANHNRECQCGIVNGNESRGRRTRGDASRHEDDGGLGFEELIVVFFVAEETHIVRASRVERSHSGECLRRSELAPDDVTIDPLGEL